MSAPPSFTDTVLAGLEFEHRLIEKFCDGNFKEILSREAATQNDDCIPRPPAIVNIVCAFNTGTELDLKKIASVCSNVQYNPRRFTALIMRREKPKGTALMFNTGKVVVVGCQSIEGAKKMSRTFAGILKKHVHEVKFRDFSIYNIVSNAKLPYKLNFTAVKETYTTDEIDSSCNQFPGLHMSYDCGNGGKISVTLFSTGSIVFMGAKKKDDIDIAYEDLKKKLAKFQYNDGA